MKKWVIYDNQDPLTLHGVEFRAKIVGNDCEGKISIDGKNIYLCQDKVAGDSAPDKLGYTYSWFVGRNSLDIEYNVVTDLYLYLDTEEQPIKKEQPPKNELNVGEYVEVRDDDTDGWAKRRYFTMVGDKFCVFLDEEQYNDYLMDVMFVIKPYSQMRLIEKTINFNGKKYAYEIMDSNDDEIIIKLKN
jgi:hypothetical protein